MLTLLKKIFTWWNQDTFGTRLKTIFFGKLVGDDVPIIKFHKNELKRVMFKDDHFVINDKQFIQLAEGSNLNNWKTLVQFQYKLKSSKIGEVQKIYPSMEAPKVMIPRLKKLIKENSI